MNFKRSGGMDRDEAAAWMALSLARGFGTRSKGRLIRHFGSPHQIWSASWNELAAVPEIGARAIEIVLKGPDIDEAMHALDTLDSCGAWLMTCTDEDYPFILSSIHDFPPVLFGKGRRDALSMQCVAVVGSRAASSYGRRAASLIATGLATKGICVVSGLALGIDSAAHAACLDGDGTTVAVTGCGIDMVYPARNRKLAERICEHGAIITEFPPGMHPEPANFPRRNRIISGLSSGVVVIEAGRKSGSLITASLALEQGREVMAVPGSIFSFNSSGTHWLIRQGAALVTDADDVVEALGCQGMDAQACVSADLAKRDSEDAPSFSDLSEMERKLFEKIEQEPVHIDELSAQSNIPVAQAAGLLVQMELKGLVQVLPGQMYCRAK